MSSAKHQHLSITLIHVLGMQTAQIIFIV